MRADVGSTSGRGSSISSAEHAAAARQVADRGVRRRVDAGREEALEARRSASSTPIAA